MKYILCLVVLTCSTANSQIARFNYIPLEFKELEPLWSHVSFDSTIVNLDIDSSTASYDGYSHIRGYNDIETEPVIKDGYLYQVQRTMYADDIAGAIIEKLDLETGEVIWQTQFDTRDSGIQEYVFRSIIEGDRLTLYNLDIIPAQVLVVAGLGSGYLKVREFSLEDGSLLFESFPDVSDPGTKGVPVSRFGSSVMTVSEDGETIEVRSQQFVLEHGRVLVIDSLDRSGRTINTTDTLFSNLDVKWTEGYRLNSFKFKRLPNDSLVWLLLYTPATQDASPPFAQLNFYHDNELTRFSEIDISPLPDLLTLGISAITPDLILFTANFFNDGFGFIEVDRGSGMITYAIRHRYLNNDYGWEELPLYDGNKFIMSDFRRDGGLFPLEIYERVGDELNLKQTLFIKEDNYGAAIDNMYKLDNDDYLVTLTYSEMGAFTFRGRHEAVIRVSPEQLGLGISSTGDLDDKHLGKTTIFPNPSVDMISVEVPINCDHVYIVDLSGQVLHSEKDVVAGMYQIDVSHLVSGSYYLNISDDRKLETIRFVKIGQ